MKNVKTFLTLSPGLLLAWPSAAADSYNIDSKKSKVTFKIRNKPPGAKEFQEVPGSFKDFSGIVVFDSKNPSKSSVQMEVKTTSVDTKNRKRDKHLRNQDFFKVKEHPTMSFKSTKVKKTSDKNYEVTGNFTLLGKSKPITVKFEVTGESSGKTSFQIKRSEYGMKFRVPDTADEVDVTLEIVATKK